MKIRSKGFTLIELLAVIVILAIIAVIATPTILGVIEKARKGAAKSSALGYIDAVEKQIAINEVDSSAKKITDGNYTVVKDSGIKKEGSSDVITIQIKGTYPEEGSIKIEKNQVTSYELKIKINKKEYTIKDGNIAGSSNSENTKTGPTMEAAKTGETHKGIVYLDPTDLTKSCNESNSVSTTETKTGCMKWYIYDNSGDNYKLILDHNTTAIIKWNDDNINVAYESSNLYAVVQDLKSPSGSGWVVNPDLITAEEVTKIVGGVSSWDSTNNNTWYYLDTKTQTKADFTSARSKYDWLYNNLYKCKTDSTDYGCSIEDNNTYQGYGTAGEGQIWAYWTKTTVGPAGSGSRVWRVNRYGHLSGNYANSANVGVRPVITISKSIVS